MNNLKGKTSNALSTANHMSIEQFADRLGALMRKMARNIMSAERNYLTRGVITLPQLWVLHEIADAENCPMSLISRHLGIKSSTVTGIMDRLVELELARRSPSELDRRSVLAEITPKGRRILEQIHAEKKLSLINLFGRITVQERADYLAIIEKITSEISPTNGNKRSSNDNTK